ncbi:MAG: tetratricopeptide repeat protein [Flavobacteriales bacterium]|nr:tetratricopeptide repeat protein [Flavobacteriales bacterium]
MKGLRFVAVIITVFSCSSISAAELVPFYEGLAPNTEQLFEKMQKEHRVGSSNSCLYANELVRSTADSDFELRLWSKLTYAYLLLENDSILKAEQLLSDSSILADNDLNGWLKGFYDLDRSLVYSYKGDYFKADRLLRDAIKNTGTEYRELYAKLNALLADNLRYQGKLEQSLVKWFETLNLSEELNDSALIADVFVGRGTVRFLQEDLDRAEQDIQVFFNYNKRIGNKKNVAYGWSLLGLIEYQRGNYQKSIEYNITGYELRKDIHDLKGQGESLNNLALGYMGLKNWTQALRYLQEAIEVKTRANDLTQTTVILNNIGHCFAKLGDKDEALRYFELALEKGVQNGQMRDVVRSYENIIRIHSKEENYRAAFDMQTKLLALKDSLNTAERNEAINELEVRYGTETKEQEIQLLQQEKTIVANRWLTLAMGLFLAIIFGILFIDNQKRKHRQETQLLVAQDELRRLELKNMADQLGHNQKKLALYTENLIKKNELVGQLENRLKETVETAISEPSQGKKIMDDFSSVRILTEDDWNEFKELFDGVHRGLLDRLLETYNGLTLADQRLFLLMKLNLSTIQIANILGVSPDSIKKGRYRLKKKLSLENEMSLQDFVTSF